MKKLTLLLLTALNIMSFTISSNPYMIPKDHLFFKTTQINSKKVTFEGGTVKVPINGTVSIECDELTLNENITIEPTDNGKDTDKIRIEIYYKKIKGTGKILNGMSSFVGEVTFILKQK